MAFANNDGICIHYTVEGNSPPLVLHHGFASSLSTLYDFGGYVQALRDDYEPILMNARGHENRDKPHSPEAYNMRDVVGDVIAVLDDLNI